jgi:organic hydroperoxide reductase OsmC/OhrA
MGSDSFTSRIEWTGNRGAGTAHYRAYGRDWQVAVPGKPAIPCSNDPALGGDPARMNPEDLLLSALAGCHMLWYLHLAADAGVVVTAYSDAPEGIAEHGAGGAGRFCRATLRPVVTLAPGSDVTLAQSLHHRIHEVCFIARSVAFPVTIEPQTRIAAQPQEPAT